VVVSGPEVHRLVEMHLAWLGGRQALSQIGDLTSTGQLLAAGLERSVVRRETRTGSSRYEVLGPVLARLVVVGVDGAWARNQSGQVEPLGDHAAQSQRRTIARNFRLPLLQRDVQLHDLGKEERDGRSWRVVRLS
jgi:hypothetical protein